MANPAEATPDYIEHIFENVTDYSQLDPMIVQGILRCVSGSGMDTTAEDTLHHIQGDVVTVNIDRESGEVFAFSSTVFGSPNEIFQSSEFSDVQGCYLAGATIDKERQGTGFYKKMNEGRVGIALDRKLPLIFTRTQNPRVQAGIQAVLESYKERGLIADYKLDRILIPGCYGHMLTKERPFCDGVSFDELDYDKGDAYVLLFSLQYALEE
ncbi:MAG: hypothetical protein PVJ09_02440 [Candidatus Woesebacteria bacterium]|jgi:hypothetical protein